MNCHAAIHIRANNIVECQLTKQVEIRTEDTLTTNKYYMKNIIIYLEKRNNKNLIQIECRME